MILFQWIDSFVYSLHQPAIMVCVNIMTNYWIKPGEKQDKWATLGITSVSPYNPNAKYLWYLIEDSSIDYNPL